MALRGAVEINQKPMQLLRDNSAIGRVTSPTRNGENSLDYRWAFGTIKHWAINKDSSGVLYFSFPVLDIFSEDHMHYALKTGKKCCFPDFFSFCSANSTFVLFFNFGFKTQPSF